MKFGDVVACVASLAVIFVLLSFPIDMVLVAALGYYWGLNIGPIVSILLGALIGGYIFAARIWEEARMEAIAKVTVLAAVLMIFSVMIEAAAIGDWTQWVKETYNTANPGAALSTSDWYAVESTFLVSQIFLNVVIVAVLGFVGLYVGSMLRRPAKSQE